MEKKKTNLQIEVINRIKRIRQENNISQKDLADYLDVTAGEIGNIESLKYKNKYTLKHLMLISKKLQVPINNLLFDEPEEGCRVEVVLERVIEYLN